MNSTPFHRKIKLKLQAYLASDLGFVINTFLIWRILILFVGLSGYFLIPHESMIAVEFDYGEFWNIWARWDGWHYIRNSINGYPLDHSSTAFFPLYSFLIAGLRMILPINPVFAGLLISNLSLIFAGYFLIKLVKLDFSEDIAKKTFIFLLAFPSAVFLASVYTESLFLLWIIGAMYFARRGKWLYVFIFGFFASLTRNMGVLLCLPLLMEYFYQYRFAIKKQIFALFGPPLGVATYMAYLYAKFGDPLKFLSDQASWGREIVWNVLASYKKLFLYLLDFLSHPNAILFFEFGLVSLAILLTSIAFFYKKFRKSYAVLMLLLMLPPLMQNVWTSTNRYMLVLFPGYILLAIFANRYKYLGDLLIIAFSLFLALHTVLFVNYMWAG